MQHKPLHIYWFSGSGNTLKAVESFAARLRELGGAVELHALEKSDPERIDPDAAFGLAFPTHCFSIPEIVRAFVKRLPTTEGTPAMMLGTHGAFSGGVCGPMKRILRKKGFRCVAGRIFIMPDSFFPYTGEKFNRFITERALKNVAKYAELYYKLEDKNKTSWSYWPVLSDICGLVLGTVFASRKLSHSFHTTVYVAKNKCTRCGICVKLCPTSAIQPDKDGFPTANINCVNCLRCVAVCQHDAMKHVLGFHSYRIDPAAELCKTLYRFSCGEKADFVPDQIDVHQHK